MNLTVKNIPTKVERIGFVSNRKPGEDPGPGYMENNVYATEDGRKFVEVSITSFWREYDETKDGPIWTEDLWQFVLRNTPKKVINVGKPAVLRLVPGMNHDNPIVVVFNSEEDAALYWESDNASDDSGERYCYLYVDGKIDITSFTHVDIKNMSHEQLQNLIDEKYGNWALRNNWLKLDDAAYRFVCGDADDDRLYCEWVEESLGIKHDAVFFDEDCL